MCVQLTHNFLSKQITKYLKYLNVFCLRAKKITQLSTICVTGRPLFSSLHINLEKLAGANYASLSGTRSVSKLRGTKRKTQQRMQMNDSIAGTMRDSRFLILFSIPNLKVASLTALSRICFLKHLGRVYRIEASSSSSQMSSLSHRNKNKKTRYFIPSKTTLETLRCLLLRNRGIAIDRVNLRAQRRSC